MADTNSAKDNIQATSSPQVMNHDFIEAASSISGGDTPRLFPRQTLTGNARGIQQFGTPNLFADSGNNYFGVAKNNVTQVLMGNQPTFGEGFYVTKDGIDATTTTSPTDFIFNSNQNIFKIISTGSISIDVPNPLPGAAILQGVYAHNLGYTPSFTVYGNIPSGAGAYSGTGALTNLPVIVGGSGAITVMAQASADETYLTIRIINMLGAGVSDLGTPWVFKYYLLQETAN